MVGLQRLETVYLSKRPLEPLFLHLSLFFLYFLMPNAIFRPFPLPLSRPAQELLGGNPSPSFHLAHEDPHGPFLVRGYSDGWEAVGINSQVPLPFRGRLV